MTFGDHIRKLRKAQGISQRELAEQAEIDFTYLSKIENSRMEPPSEGVIQRIAVVLGVNADELLVLADKFPSDLADALKDRETISALRRSLEGDFVSFEDFKRALGRRTQPKG